MLKGVLTKIKDVRFDDKITLINSSLFASEAGLAVETQICSSKSNAKVYKNFISVELKSDNNNYARKVLGTVINGEVGKYLSAINYFIIFDRNI